MRVLVTNDDGILADGLWVLAAELNKAAEVVVVAPDREQSAIGTAVTLTQPLRVQRARPLVPGIEAYAVQGTPGDSVIVALEKLFPGSVDVVVSGINQGLNLGNDVLISGTVGAALQGYLRGLPAVAVSLSGTESKYLEGAAWMGAAMAKAVWRAKLAGPVLLNVNLPDRLRPDLMGVKVTRLAGESHIDTVQEGHDGKRSYYWLVRRRAAGRVHADTTDIGAVDHGYVSVTPLHIYQGGSLDADELATDALCCSVSEELAQGIGDLRSGSVG